MEGIVKTLTKGNQILEHIRLYDDMGLLRDAFQMVKLSENPKDGGARTIKPFFGKMKVSNFRLEDPIQTFTDYTDEEYEEMFEKNKFTHLEAEKNNGQETI